jgi:hypothetical protein
MGEGPAVTYQGMFQLILLLDKCAELPKVGFLTELATPMIYSFKPNVKTCLPQPVEIV